VLPSKQPPADPSGDGENRYRVTQIAERNRIMKGTHRRFVVPRERVAKDEGYTDQAAGIG